MTTALYRYYADDDLLYVGISSRLPRRVKEHVRDLWWEQTTRIDIEWHPTREAALEAEREAIRAEQPRHNVIHRHAQVTTPSWPLRVRVEDALAAQGRDLGAVVSLGRRDGLSVEDIYLDIRRSVGIPFSISTLYRWAESLEVAS